MGLIFMRVGKAITFGIWMVSMFAACSEAAINLGKNLAVEILHMETPTDVSIMSALVFVGYICQYALMGGAFEMTSVNGFQSPALNASHQARRKAQIEKEIRIGFTALLCTVVLTLFFMRYGEPIMPFYGFFETHEYNIWWFLGGAVAYVIGFDTWFYWSHRWLHDIDWLWNNVHFIHHQFKEPSAFAQFATHPIEAAMQGPIGHYMCTLIFPMHPVAHAVFGFFSSAYAIAAHDGRWNALTNYHYFHHSKGRGRFIYFNMGFLTPCWDVWCNTRWHENHAKWVNWKTKRGTEVFDTVTGEKGGSVNDVYAAYGGALDGMDPIGGAKKIH